MACAFRTNPVDPAGGHTLLSKIKPCKHRMGALGRLVCTRLIRPVPTCVGKWDLGFTAVARMLRCPGLCPARRITPRNVELKRDRQSTLATALSRGRPPQFGAACCVGLWVRGVVAPLPPGNRPSVALAGAEVNHLPRRCLWCRARDPGSAGKGPKLRRRRVCIWECRDCGLRLSACCTCRAIPRRRQTHQLRTEG